MKIRSQLGPIPEKVICLIPDLNLALERSQLRDGRRYTASEIDFTRKTYYGFLAISEIQKKRIVTVNSAGRSEEEIISSLEKILRFN